MSHLLDSLNAAAKLAVRQDGYAPGCINLSRWAVTYRCTPDDVEQALHIAENGSRKLPEEQAAASPQPKPAEEGHDE